MSDKGKKIFLALSIVVPFLIYCVYYYGMMVKNAPYKFAEFESLTFKYGEGDSLVNQYDSKTRSYQYLNDRDSLIKKQVKLTKDDLLFLHRKAVEYGFWDFPSDLTVAEGAGGARGPRYYLEYKYKRKSKKVTFDVNYNGNPKLKDAVRGLIETVDKTINTAEDRGKK
ncbi:hypothetical protein [Arcticibacter sp. MXS-1]|uniref:hypothetical protein n=1 Tax=Arcticibacter sp. MXS-1 TaxID=3341726 RepID=UPI0035A8316A